MTCFSEECSSSTRYGRTSVVKYLLECKCDPNCKTSILDGRNTPLSFTQNTEIMRQLIKHGANPKSVYSNLFPASHRSKPPEPVVTLYIVGDPGAGKSTLTASLKAECKARGFSRLAKRIGTVTGVEQKTAGVIPHEIESAKFGSVLLYDFAGHKEFYGSHDALLSNTLTGSSAAVFIIVADLRLSDDDFCQKIRYWLQFIGDRSKADAHTVIVGSHADQVKPEEKASKAHLVTALDFTAADTHFTGFVPMDCQFAVSSAMTQLVKLLTASCDTLRTKGVMNIHSHCFLMYLLEQFPGHPAIQLSQVEDAIMKEGAKKRAFVPDSLDRLVEACQELKERGNLLILEDEENKGNSWIVVDQTTLLTHVTGTIFAPDGFKKHCDLASNTGVVTLSKISTCFSDLQIDINVIVKLLCHLEYCQEVSDPEVLKILESNNSTSAGERFFYFPALVSVEVPEDVWAAGGEYSYHSGSVLQCSRPDQFLTVRFLQVLLLRLAFAFALAPHSEEVDVDHPAIQKKCKVWKSGLNWSQRSGVEALVDISGTSVTLLTRCLKGNEMALVSHRSAILHKIRQARIDLLPKTATTQYFLKPSEAKHFPVQPSSEATGVSVFEIAQAIVRGEPCALDKRGTPVELDNLLHFEPYAQLYEHQAYHDDSTGVVGATVVELDATLVELFDPSEPHSKEQVSHRFLSRLAKHITENKRDKLHGIFSRSPTNPPIRDLRRWRSATEGTYQCLRRMLDSFSVFAGTSPLEIAVVPQHKGPPFTRRRGVLLDEQAQAVDQEVLTTELCMPLAKQDDAEWKPVQLRHQRHQSARTGSPTDSSVSERAQEESRAIHLRDLVRHVKTTNWYGLGLELGVDEYTLDLVHEDQRGDNRAQLRRMFQEWLRESEEPTWEAVVQALTAIGEDTLASDIEEQFL